MVTSSATAKIMSSFHWFVLSYACAALSKPSCTFYKSSRTCAYIRHSSKAATSTKALTVICKDPLPSTWWGRSWTPVPYWLRCTS
jgi:hypothetical protein